MRISFGTVPTLAAAALLTTALSAQQPASPAPSDDTTAQAAPVHANSKVRIVRLSEVKGEVSIDRSTGQGFEQAIANIPIIENAQLKTVTGAAEVEFEDNSTLRVGPDSLVTFPKLEMQPDGVKLSTIALQQGLVYVSLLNTKDEFTLAFGQQKVHLQPSSHIRLQVEPSEARLAVFEGSARVEGPAGTLEAAKKKTLVFNLADPNAMVVAKNVEPDPFDNWDHQSSDYHKHYTGNSALAGSPYSYGASDLMYYGNFVNAGGCGTMWQPYFVSAGWDPFANGMWAYYPGAGYSWVSPYPWGWMPFHYGNWVSCPGMGWGWQPGGAWDGLGNQPTALGTGGMPVKPVKPPQEPGGRGYVVVNQKPLASSFGSGDSFVFRKDSAGFGVPRGSLGKLDSYSREAIHHGSSSIPVYSIYASGSQGGHSHVAQAGMVESPHPGVAPPSYQNGAGSSMERSAGGSQHGYSMSAPNSAGHMGAPGGSPSGSGSGSSHK
ncbi:MAG: FecR domain-containing protein [Silvibacterium sp.]|nr:FecR domain-containing protein [Silvibacterium sp.]